MGGRSSDEMAVCNHLHTCTTCANHQINQQAKLSAAIKEELKPELRQELINELVPLLAKLFSRREGVFEDAISKLQENYSPAPENSDQLANNDDSQKLMITEIKSAREEVQKVRADLADLPVMRQQMREMCYSAKEPTDVLESAMQLNGMEVAQPDLLMKENFLKERIEALEESGEKMKIKRSVKRTKKRN